MCPSSLLCSVPTDAWKTRSAESESDNAKIRPRRVVDEDNSRSRRLLLDNRVRDDDDDGDGDDDD